MRIAKLLKVMGCVTALALVYIHLQMQILDLAYQGKTKDQHIKKLLEDNGNISYAISTLKSANYLGFKMFNEDSDMQFIDQENIMQVTASDDNEADSVSLEEASLGKGGNSLLSLLTFRSK